MTGLVRVIVGKASAIVAVLFLGVGVFLIAAVGPAEHEAGVTDGLPRGYDSTTAAQLREKLPQREGAAAVVLFTAQDRGALRGGAVPQLGDVVDQVDVKHVTAPPQGPRVVPSQDGKAALAVLSVDTNDATTVSRAITDLREQLEKTAPDGVRAQVAGPAAIQADLAAVFEGANFRLLAATASVVAILLVITYRSPVLWLVPLLVIGVADQVASVLATHSLATLGLPWDDSTTGILSVLVFGAGTDYALLLISRYRDELRRHEARREAMELALRRTAHAVLASATTVVLGVLTLALSLVPTTRALGVACAVGIVVAAFFALVVLPATLVIFGRWIFWPKIPHVGSTSLAEGHSAWRRVGDTVARRPTAFAAGTLVLLAVLATGLLGAKLGLPTAEQFLKKPEAIAAGQELGRHFPAGSADPAVVLTKDARGAAQALDRVAGVDSVRPGPSGNGWSQLDAVLAQPADSATARATVERMRTALADVPGTDHVGGTAAEALDEADAAARDRWVIFPTILLLVLGGLIVLLRSLVAPVLLVLTVLGTYVAALGASWWLFTGVFGFSALDLGTPLFAFLFLVALGVDYNIFLVTRAWEETAGHGTHEGMLRALAATGGVITSAGILLAAVFAVLGVLPLVVLAQLGVVICIGVLLDTLVVRTVLVPALALRLGDRFWWPRRVPTG